ncbi:MAG: hypothetical protein ABIS01_12530 [Ferruginibacter sp.]
MNFQKIFSTLIFLMLTIYSAGAQNRTSISPVVFKNLTGCWQGRLNYSGTVIRKPYSTPAELVIKQTGMPGKFEFLNIYTKDPNENVPDTITISNDGRKINDATIKSNQTTPDGNLKIVAEVLGFDHDNNKAAIIRHTYTIGKNIYTYKKETQPEGQTDWLEKQEFKYVRKPCN